LTTGLKPHKSINYENIKENTTIYSYFNTLTLDDI
jgi:hypothetical protein